MSRAEVVIFDDFSFHFMEQWCIESLCCMVVDLDMFVVHALALFGQGGRTSTSIKYYVGTSDALSLAPQYDSGKSASNGTPSGFPVLLESKVVPPSRDSSFYHLTRFFGMFDRIQTELERLIAQQHLTLLPAAADFVSE